MVEWPNIASLLATSISQSLSPETRDFQWDTFFRLWYRKHGTATFFLFKRHLGVTNTQYVELFSLLQVHCNSGSDTKTKPQLLFHPTEQVKANISDAINSLLEAAETDTDVHISTFAERYSQVLASTVAVDLFHCSCAVFLPPGLTLDVKQICADAGYIHSAGHSIYIRNITKARIKDFQYSIQEYLKDFEDAAFPIPFVVYAHEDFSDWDKDVKEQISRGIEHTKLYLEKMSMGGYRLAQVVQDMRKQFEGKLEIPEPGRYDELHDFRKDRTLWLISDRSASLSSPMSVGNQRYYICYEQTVKGDNPFFYFDENKTAWKSHTTLPHSLTAALINATRPHTSLAQICDPFSGTGTTWFEAKRLGLNIGLSCSDRSQAFPLMVADNLQFFLSNALQLGELNKQLRDILKAVEIERRSGNQEIIQESFDFAIQREELSATGPYLYAVKLLHELKHEQPTEDQEFTFSAEFVAKLRRLSRITRLLFYVVLRAELRYQGGYRRRSVTFDKAFEASLGELMSQIDQLIKLREDVEGSETISNNNYVEYQDKYSCSVVPALLLSGTEQFSGLETEIIVRDARNLPANSIDVILCDPPYGFNTSEDRDALAALYSDFLDSAIAALKDKGQLIICLPAESYTGRDLPYCTRSSLITNQVLTKSKAMKKYVYVAAQSLPSRAFAPPYYWEAERALRRVILHFRIASE